MQLELRHLSGSRAGEVESFDDSSEITVGRHPSSRVLFDPDRDRSVSGNHASINFENGQWVLRDVGSSNGTYVDEQKVTEQPLRNGQIIQFGSSGPKVRVSFADTMPGIGAAPPVQAEGHTVMMMMPQDGGAPAGAPAYTMPRKKKGGMGRALLMVGAAIAILLIGLVALALVMRSNNLRKKRQMRAEQTTTAATTTQTTTAQTTTENTATLASSSTADAEVLKQQIADTQQSLQSAQESLGQGDQNASQIADLKRQIAESQALVEQMTRELQQKNDEIAAERARADQRPKVVYVPTTPKQAPAPAPSNPVATSTPQPVAPTQNTYREETPAQVAETTAPPRPSNPAKGPRTTPSSSRTTPSTTPSQVASSPPPPPSAPLYKTKSLKLKVSISSVPPEIPPAGLPSGTDRGLVNLISSALVSSGDYVVGANGQANVSVMVTNYKAIADRNLNTQGAASSARKLGKLFGQKLPGNPVDVKNVSYDAAMSARVRLLDRTGRVLLESEPSSASKDRKAKVAVAGVNFNDTALSDTAIGDVTRKVVADAVDSLRSGLRSFDWSTPVASASKDKVLLGVGSSAFIEPGDVFEVVDPQQRVLARVRVTSVTENSAEAMLITDPGKTRLASMTARYLGNESASGTHRSPRTITTRAKTPVYDGPGTSFNQLRELKPGVQMNLEFTVGAWAKANDGSGTVWVPLANATIGS